MSNFQFFKSHKAWEDWCGMLLGVTVVLSPWLARQPIYGLAEVNHGAVILNTFTVGLMVLGLAQLEYMVLRRWEEIAMIVLGLWLIVTPLALGYSGDGTLRFWHTSLGCAVLLLAILQLWQDWDLSDREMTRQTR